MPTTLSSLAMSSNLGNLIHALEEEMFSHDPNSIGRRTLVEILETQEMYSYGIYLIANDQLWEEQINRYGEKLPLYKPDTIRKKNKLGHPADKLVRYTNYWTGAFTNQGIVIEVDLDRAWYDFVIRGKWAEFIPEDRVGLTPENEEKFKAYVEQEWRRRMQIWFNHELRTRDLNDYA